MTGETDHQSSDSQAWENVGRQFRSLGESLASAFKSSLEKDETRQHLEKMQAEVETMAAEIARSTKEVVDSEEGQKLRAEVEEAAQSARAAGQQTAEELRPHLLDAFRRVRSELDQVITRLEQEQKKGRVALLASVEKAGYLMAESSDSRFLMHFGHPEFEADSIQAYCCAGGRDSSVIPANFNPDNPVNTWRSHRNTLFGQWIKYIHETRSY